MMRISLSSRPSRSSIAKAAVVAVGAAAALGVASQALAAISSNVYIEPGATFVLGGAQPGDFAVRGQNRGDVTVEVYVREDGANGPRDTLISTVEPGGRFDAGFVEGEGALLRNTSGDARAHVRVRITGTTRNLGMRYEGE